MQTSPERSGGIDRLTAVLALAVTLYGMANVMPAIGDLRLGPFPMEMFRASFVALCAWVVALGMRNAVNQPARGWLRAVSLVGGVVR